VATRALQSPPKTRKEDRPLSEGNTPLGVYEMLWDCEYCGTKKLLGKTHRHCPECGATQDAQKRYFPADEDKVEVKDHVFVGADKHCDSCGAASGARAKHCGQCGAPLDGQKEIGRRASETAGEGQKFVQTSTAAAPHPGQPATAASLAAAGDEAVPDLTSGGGGRQTLHIGIGLAVLVVVGLLLAVLLWKKEIAVESTGHSWLREVHIESFERRSQSGWCDEMPHDARHVLRSREVRSHREVADGETCKRNRIDNGDGTFREERECRTKYRKEPVYDEHCRYEVDRWGPSRTLKQSGSNTSTSIGAGTKDAPSWPDVSSIREGSCLGCERESSRTQTYTLHLRDPKSGKTYDCDFPERVWAGIPVGKSFKTKAGVVLRRLDCSQLLDNMP
jgi:hypothetical protein